MKTGGRQNNLLTSNFLGGLKAYSRTKESIRHPLRRNGVGVGDSSVITAVGLVRAGKSVLVWTYMYPLRWENRTRTTMRLFSSKY